MAIVHKCDRCGTIYERTAISTPKYKVIKECFGSKPIGLDLCLHCLASLEVFLSYDRKEKYQ